MLNGVVDIEERSDEMLFFVLFRSEIAKQFHPERSEGYNIPRLRSGLFCRAK